MEKIRRNLKIFWTEHGTPILFWLIVIGAVVIIVQLLNNYAIQKNKKENSTQEKNENMTQQRDYQQNIYQENKDDTALINQFLECCKNDQVEEAYAMLSENCKKDLYPTVEDFSALYYNKIFDQNRDIKIEHDTKNDVYQIIFLEDILEAGKIENRDSITDQYKIEKEILENKIYINYNKSIK